MSLSGSRLARLAALIRADEEGTPYHVALATAGMCADKVSSTVTAARTAEAVKAGGAKVNLKRQPAAPRAGFAIKGNPEYRAPAAYVALV